jgi:predicted patatin/cPLA2 family phospholipase
MNAKTGRSALVVEGGGMRGMFTAGVLHAFGSAGFDPFDLYIGVSAGACNLTSHLAGQNDRNYEINIKYSTTPDFINPWRFLLGGHLMDIDWLWDISMKEYPIDLERLFTRLEKEKKEFIVVATSVESGRAMYLAPGMDTIENYTKVSSSVPLFYRNVLEVDSEKATDGGVADSIPVIEAYNRGATDITVLRTRPSDYVKKQSRLSFLYPLFFRKHRVLARALADRPLSYMKAVEFMKNPPAGIRINEIAPPKDLKVNRATRDPETLKRAYRIGIEYGKRFIEKYNSGV